MNDYLESREKQQPFQAIEPALSTEQMAEGISTPEPTSRVTPGASLLHTILPILAGATLLVYLTMVTAPNPRSVFIATTLLLVVIGISYVLLRSGRSKASGIVLSGGLWVVLAITAYYAEGVSNAPYVGLVMVVLIAGLAVGGAAGWTFAALNAALGLLLVIASLSNILPPPLMPYNAVSFWIAMSVISLASAGLIYLAVNKLHAALAQSQRNERAQAQANREMQILRAALEQQVVERSRQLQERAHYLEAAVEINRATSSTLDREQLMQVAVNLICEQFALDYAGLYLVDPTNTWAILRADHATLPQDSLPDHRPTQVALGSGLVGLCIANAQPRLAQEEQGQSSREVAIPLRSRGRTIGALHLISRRVEEAEVEITGSKSQASRLTFDETQIIIFQAIGDQIAVALENAHLFQEYLQAQEEMQRASGKASRESWHEILRSGANMRYRYDRSADRVMPIQDGQTTGQTEAIDQQNDALLLPISVRDQVVGTIALTKGTERTPAKESQPEGPVAWNDEEINLLKTIVEQLGIALDSSRLYQDTQRLAYREQLTTEVTTRIRETLNIETVLRTAVQEIQKTLNLPEVVISLASPDQEAEQSD